MADGTVTIEIDLGQKGVKDDAKVIEQILNNLGKNAGEKMDASMEKHSYKMSADVRKALKASEGDFQKTQAIIDGELKKQREFKLGLDDDAAKKGVQEMRGLLGKMPKVSRVVLGARDGASKAIRGVGRSADVAHKSMIGLKGIIAGTLIGGAVISAWHKMTAGVMGFLHAGNEYNKEQQVMNSAWTTLTGNAGRGREMVDMVNRLANAAGQSADLTNELAQGFYHLHSNKQEADDMTKAMLNMGDAVGLTSAQLKTVGLDMVHGLSGGRLQLDTLNQLSDYFPMFAEEMAKHYHVTVGTLRKMVTAGKVSANDVEQVFLHLGNVQYGKAAENMLGTIVGMQRVIKARAPLLAGDFTRPFLKMQAGIFTGISNYMNSKEAENQFTEMGNAAEKGATTIMNAFGRVFGHGSVTDTMQSFTSGVTNGIGRLSDFIAAHAEDIVNFFNQVKKNGVVSFKLLAEIFHITTTALTPLMKLIASDPKDFAAFAIGIYTVVKAFRAMQAITALLGITIAATPIGWIIGAIGLLAIGAAELIIHWKEVKKFFSGLWSWMGHAAHSAGNAMVKGWNATTNQFTSRNSWLNKHTHGIFADMFTGLKSVARSGYKSIQDRQQTFNDLIHGRWNKLGKDVQRTTRDDWKTLKSYFHAGYNSLNDITGGRLESMRKKMASWGSKTVSWWRSLPGKWSAGIRHGYSGMVDAAKHLGNGMISGIAKGVNGVIGGVNWVLDRFHAHNISPWKPKYFATGGRAFGPSVVGEKGKHELIKHADGHIEVSPNRATLYNFRQPVDILGGDKTEQLMNSGLLPMYGIGTWLGDAVDFVKGGWNAIKGAGASFWNAVTHPKQLVTTAVGHFADLAGVSGVPLTAAQGAVKTLTSDAVDFVKKQFEANNPGGSGVGRWAPYVMRALGMNGLSTSASMVAKVLRQIGTESGGNPSAVQHGYTDINTIHGDLAKGLMQTISTTFSHYAFAGYGNIFNGFDNLLAAINYAKHRYGPNLSALGNGHGYAFGTTNSIGGDVSIAEVEPEVVAASNGESYVVSRPTRYSNFPSGAKVIPMSSVRRLGEGTTARVSSFLSRVNGPRVNVPLSSNGTATGYVGAQNKDIKVVVTPQTINVQMDGKTIWQETKKWEKKDERTKNLIRGTLGVNIS